MSIVVIPLTLTLAKAIGVYMIAAGLSGLLAPARWTAILDALRANAALTYLAGVAAFGLGAAIAIAHTVWTDPLAIAVTLIGWAGVIEGVLLIAWPKPILDLGASLVRPAGARPMAIVALVAGAILLVLGLIGRAGPVA
jgi:hypothetical protein